MSGAHLPDLGQALTGCRCACHGMGRRRRMDYDQQQCMRQALVQAGQAAGMRLTQGAGAKRDVEAEALV